MNARRLLYWGDLDQRRRRRGARGLGRLPAAVWSALAAVALTGIVARFASMGGGDAITGSRFWLAAVVAAHVVVMFGAPFRMFWRRDSALLARLAIPGDALYKLALVRGVRATALVAVPCAIAVAPFGYWGNWEIAGRHLLVVGVAALGGALLSPAAALAGGAIVASSKADALMESIGGEFQAPKTSWLGLLPGLAATGIVLAIIAAGDWVAGAQKTAVGEAALLFGLVSGGCVVLGLWSLAASKRVMGAALREVAALDQERLAHIDRSQPSPIERAWSRLLRKGARHVFAKDARLARRRYPIPYFVGLVGLLSLWGIAIGAPAMMVTWAGVVAACLGVYQVVMAKRRTVAPIEYPRLLRSLALRPSDPTTAKRGQALLSFVVYLAAGIAPVIARAPEPLSAGLVLGGIALGTLAAAVAIAGRA